MHVFIYILSWYKGHVFFNPRCVGGLSYSSVCVCVRVHVRVCSVGLPGDLDIMICTYLNLLVALINTNIVYIMFV